MDCMDEPTTIAWIFCAVAMASENGPANRREISLVADGINHAVPTHNEMESSLSWLKTAGFIKADDRKAFSLSSDGKNLYVNAAAGQSITECWAKLSEVIAERLRNGTAHI